MSNTRERFTALCYPGAAVMAHTTNPLLAARVILAIEGDDRYRVASTGRTYASQKAKYDPWLRNGPPPPAIANPDHRRSDGTLGSRHMVQTGVTASWTTTLGETYLLNNFSNAVDVVPHNAGSRKGAWYAELEHTMADVGLKLCVGAYDHGSDGLHTRRTAAFEPWHYQLNEDKDFDTALTMLAYHDILLTGMPDVVIPANAVGLAKITAFNNYVGLPSQQWSKPTWQAIATFSQYLAGTYKP